MITPIVKTRLHNQSALECIITYSTCMFIHWTCIYNIILYIYATYGVVFYIRSVTVFVKRDHLGANLDIEFCMWSESTR